MISSKSLTELFRYIYCFIFAVVMIFPIIFSKAASYQTRVRGMRMSSAVESIRISTYNVLSSSLGGQDYYVACNPDWLSPKHRFKKLKEKLEPEIEKNSIICLQELSISWIGSLHSHFLRKGYYLVTSSYGNKFNGYMGVGIAVPLGKYDILGVDITRIADTKRSSRKRMTGLSWYLHKALNPIKGLAKKFGWKPPVDIFYEATGKNNQMVCIRFSVKGESATENEESTANSRKRFVVGTYHMPCVFKLPQLMTIHCALSAQHIHKFSGSDPYVYAGDFNIKPKDSMYKLLTSGDIDQESPDRPLIPEGDDWKPNVTPLRSAYKEHLGSEPAFTNWAKVKQEDPFIDTLDYIFLSDEWRVESVRALPSKEELPGPYPIEDEPSDHLMLSASLLL